MDQGGTPFRLSTSKWQQSLGKGAHSGSRSLVGIRFAVANRHRRSSVGSVLLEAAVEFAREHGATALEGHPVDVAALSAARVGGAAIFTGTVAMFSAAGFVEVARTAPSRPVMRLPL